MVSLSKIKSMKTSTLILPCYNAESFLEERLSYVETFLSERAHWSVVLVNDGSGDRTIDVLHKFRENSLAQERISLLDLEVNVGKGGAIMAGLQEVKTEYVAYTDCDLAYPLSNLDVFERNMRSGSMVIGNRVHEESTYSIRPAYFRYIATRHLASRIFNLFVRLALGLNVNDTQAGLKMFFADDFRRCIERLTQKRFSFDLELLAIAKAQSLKVVQCPVSFRFEENVSSVRFVYDAFLLGRDLMRIMLRSWIGKYR